MRPVLKCLLTNFLPASWNRYFRKPTNGFKWHWGNSRFFFKLRCCWRPENKLTQSKSIFRLKTIFYLSDFRNKLSPVFNWLLDSWWRIWSIKIDTLLNHVLNLRGCSMNFLFQEMRFKHVTMKKIDFFRFWNWKTLLFGWRCDKQRL